MVRSVLLTIRMHRFEIFFSLVLMALTAISAVVVYTHVAAANPADQCWKENWDVSGTLTPTPGCAAQVAAFWGVQSEALFVASPIGVLLPFVVGLLLGVPVVGAELEMRTAAFAWSLSGDRFRWLLVRFLPVLAIGLVGLVITAGLVAEMARAAHPWSYLGPGRIPDLTEIGSEGPALVGRGILAIGIGLLVGALAGRTMPAFALSAVVCFALLTFGVPVLQSLVADRVAVWQEQSGGVTTSDKGVVSTGPSGAPYLVYFGDGFRDASGSILTLAQAEALQAQQCPDCPPGDDTWIYANLTQVRRVAPIESYPTFELADTAASSGIGVLCMLLTFPVVARRHPT